MNADESSAAPDEPLERRLLGVVQNVAGSRQEDNRLVTLETLVTEDVGVFACVHREAALQRLPLNGRDSGRDRIVAKFRGFREHQHVESRGNGRRALSGWRADCGMAARHQEKDDENRARPHSATIFCFAWGPTPMRLPSLTLRILNRSLSCLVSN